MDASNIVFIVVLLIIVILVYALYNTNVGSNNFKVNAQHWFDRWSARGKTIDKLKKDKENLIKETSRLKCTITTMERNQQTDRSQYEEYDSNH